MSMWESFFGFKKTPFSDSPDAKQLFASRPGIRSRHGSSFWPNITARVCSPAKWAPASPPPPASSPPR